MNISKCHFGVVLLINFKFSFFFVLSTNLTFKPSNFIFIELCQIVIIIFMLKKRYYVNVFLKFIKSVSRG